MLPADAFAATEEFSDPCLCCCCCRSCAAACTCACSPNEPRPDSKELVELPEMLRFPRLAERAAKARSRLDVGVVLLCCCCCCMCAA